MKKYLDRLMMRLGYVPQRDLNRAYRAVGWGREEYERLERELASVRNERDMLKRENVPMADYLTIKTALDRRWSQQETVRKMAEYRRKNQAGAAP